MESPIIEVDSIDSVYERQRAEAHRSQLLFRQKLDVIDGLLTSRKSYNWDILHLVQERSEWEEFYDALIAQANSEWDFEDGGFEIYSGNYFFGPPAHGAFVVGFKAFRWLLNQLGIKQPRRFKNELSTDFTTAALPHVPNEADSTRATSGIDNWALHKLLA